MRNARYRWLSLIFVFIETFMALDSWKRITYDVIGGILWLSTNLILLFLFTMLFTMQDYAIRKEGKNGRIKSS